ncbi:hypothetical protein BSKO_08630 [Bryopsis sp. KO-2023]|nr:hypothetical protein BSKO_08630 [Bryopsis sp. KO-2023]
MVSEPSRHWATALFVLCTLFSFEPAKAIWPFGSGTTSAAAETKELLEAYRELARTNLQYRQNEKVWQQEKMTWERERQRLKNALRAAQGGSGDRASEGVGGDTSGTTEVGTTVTATPSDLTDTMEEVEGTDHEVEGDGAQENNSDDVSETPTASGQTQEVSSVGGGDFGGGMATGTLLAFVAGVAWTCISRWIGRSRRSGTRSRGSGVRTQLPAFEKYASTLKSWNSRIQERVMRDLETTVEDIPARIRLLWSMFDQGSDFGSIMLDSLKAKIDHYTGSKPLPPDGESEIGGLLIHLEDLWDEIRALLDDFVLDDFEPHILERLKNLRKGGGENWIEFLSRFYLTYRQKSEGVEEAAAVKIFHGRLPSHLVEKILEGVNDPSEVTFDTLRLFFKKRGQIESYQGMLTQPANPPTTTSKEGNRRPPPSRKPPLQCSYCGKAGHIREECYKRRAHDAKRSGSRTDQRPAQAHAIGANREDSFGIPVATDFEHHSLGTTSTQEPYSLQCAAIIDTGIGKKQMFARVRINDRTENALIDPGSEINLVPVSYCKRWGLTISELVAPIAVLGFNSAKEDLLGSVVLPITLGSVSKDVTFYLADANKRFILGLPALNAFDVSVDCGVGQLRLPGGNFVRCHAVEAEEAVGRATVRFKKSEGTNRHPCLRSSARQRW